MTSQQNSPARPPGLLLARLAWIVPIVLLSLSLYEALAAVDLARTLREGTPAVAEVTRYERSDRKDVTNAELDLRVLMPDGSSFERRRLSLPYSIAHRVQKDTLHVRVLRGSRQEIVITAIGGTQRRIAMSNAAMSFVAMLMALVGVVAWNRFLLREGRQVPTGDEAESGGDADAEPARHGEEN